MRTLLTSDTHLNHSNIATYCQRPENFTEIIVKRWKERVKPEDIVIHLGDVFIGKPDGWKAIYPELPGRKILVRGNHDRHHSLPWWMDNGFDFACDSMIFRGCWLTHEPAAALPESCNTNIHGHLHNIWDGFYPNGSVNAADEEQMRLRNELKYPWQRLFAIEYTNYCAIEFDEFLAHPDKYKARGKR